MNLGALEPGWEGDGLGCDERTADLELDLAVGTERDLAGIAGEDVPVEKAVTAPCAGPTRRRPSGWPQMSKNSPSVNVRFTGDSMCTMPSAACVCSHMKHDPPATNRPAGVDSTW